MCRLEKFKFSIAVDANTCKVDIQHLMMQEHTLFSIIKQWSSGPNAGSTTAEVDEQLLTLIGEIRLEHIMAEHLNSILDDPWLHQVRRQSSKS